MSAESATVSTMNSQWKPPQGLEDVVDTSSVPFWPGVRPMFAPDGSGKVLTWFTKFKDCGGKEWVFFNAGYAAIEGTKETGMEKKPISWKGANELVINDILNSMITRNIIHLSPNDLSKWIM